MTPNFARTMANESKKPVETDARGIPLKSTAFPEGISVPALFGMFNVVVTAIGYVLARFVCYRSSTRDAVDAKIFIITSYDLGWLYAGVFLLKMLQIPLAAILGTNRKEAKIGVPDQQVYKVAGAAGSKLGYVLMETDGALGKFNRAQRALQNYNEQFPTVALQYVVASFCFPFEAFVCVVVWALSRCIQAVGYVDDAEGRLRGGFPGMIALNAINGMILMVAVRTLT